MPFTGKTTGPMSLTVPEATASICSNDAPIIDKNFPARLYRFLEMVEIHDISHIVSWQPNGRSFRVHKPKEFVKLSEPRYEYNFSHHYLTTPIVSEMICFLLLSWFLYTKYSSFQRQLNIYGFIRITSGSDKNGYFHEHFRRRQDQLLHKILRVPLKKDAPSISLTSSEVPVNRYEVIPTESSDGLNARHPTVTCRISNGNDIRSESEGDVQQRIEFLRCMNRQTESSRILRDDATRSYWQSLLNSSNRPTTSALHEMLISQILHNGTSMSTGNELSLALAQFRTQIASPLPSRNMEVLRQQLHLALTATSQPSLSVSQSAFNGNIALPLSRQEPWNQGTGHAYDSPLHQPRSSDLRSVASIAATNLRNKILLADQLNRYRNGRVVNAISRTNGVGDGLFDVAKGPNENPPME